MLTSQDREQHFLLQLPTEVAEALREKLQQRATKDVSITFQDDRHATFQLGLQNLNATLFDLPTILESHRTFDNKQFYKINDISQILIVNDETVPLASSNPDKKPGSSDEFQWPHGVTPPMKNVRKRRFRKRIEKVVEDVEQEVTRLLEADELADEVKATPIYEEEDSDLEQDDSEVAPDGEPDGEPDDASVMDDYEIMPADDDDEVPIPPVTQLDDDDEDDDVDENDEDPEDADVDVDGDVDIDGDDDDDDDELPTAAQSLTAATASKPITLPRNNTVKDATISLTSPTTATITPTTTSDDSSVATERLQQLLQERQALTNQLTEMEDRIRTKLSEIARCPNAILKKRFELQLSELETEKSVLQDQLSTLEQRLKR